MTIETLEDFVKNRAHYCGMVQIGCKYWETRNLDIKEIAKLVRADIKDRTNSGSLPDQKYSVKIERYRGGQSINISTEKGNFKSKVDPDRRFDPAQIRLELQYILDQYNYDGSHGMYDWLDNRFFSDVRLT